MGRLVPDDFPMATLANAAEQRVVESLRDGLTDGWLILPDVALRGRRDFQLDVVLLHREFGILDLEVKPASCAVDLAEPPPPRSAPRGWARSGSRPRTRPPSPVP